MSLPRSRSRGAPSPAPSHKSYSSRVSQSPGPGSEVRSDSFWEKMGTLGRKKKAQVTAGDPALLSLIILSQEVQQVEVEGKHAIDSPGQFELKQNLVFT